jgi:leucyl-tRNA synthetase
MINTYGADAVRLFILSDSPPEKDIQWSDTGVASANKFLQKIWNLNYLILNRKDKEKDEVKEEKFTAEIDNFVNKVSSSIDNFRFNVCIANFYQIYNYIKNNIDIEIGNTSLKINMTKVMKLMIPFTPHLAYECLELLDCKTTHNWPDFQQNKAEMIKLAIQINGKTRDIIKINIDSTEKDINSVVHTVSKAKKYIEGQKIRKVIFVKNRIINYII